MKTINNNRLKLGLFQVKEPIEANQVVELVTMTNQSTWMVQDTSGRQFELPSAILLPTPHESSKTVQLLLE